MRHVEYKCLLYTKLKSQQLTTEVREEDYDMMICHILDDVILFSRQRVPEFGGHEVQTVLGRVALHACNL